MTEDAPDLDTRLADLFAAPQAAPDGLFVAKVQRAVLAEQKMMSLRRAAWQRFAVEAVASGAIVVAFYLLWRLSPAELALDEMPIAPAVAAISIFFLWFGVELRPAATGR